MGICKKYKGQRQWIREVLNEFEALGEPYDKSLQRDGCERPDWVHNLLLLLMGVSHPGVKVKNIKKWNAKDLGRMLGRHYVLERVADENGQLPRWTPRKVR